MGSNIDVASTGALVNRLMNPPDMGAQFAKGLDALNAWKQFQANQASADAYRQAVDPQTGAIDIGKYNALLSQSPAGAWNFGQNAQQIGQAVGQQGVGTSANVEAKQKQLGALGQMMYPLLQAGANSGEVDPAAVQSQLDRAHSMGLVTDQQYTAWSGQLKGMSGKDAYGFVLGANMGNQEAYRQLGGNVSAINTGPQTVFKQVSPLGAQPPASSTTQMGLSPEGALKLQTYLAEPYDYTDKQGIEHRGGTKADYFKDNHINPYSAFTDGTIPAPGSPPTIPQAAPAQKEGAVPAEAPTTAGSVPGSGNWEVQHNNFAGMRNPNVPAAGGPNTNPAGWQQFPTPEAGVQAISNQLDRYASGATTGKPLNTLNGIISTWAPPGENPTAALIARASKIMGVSPDQPLDLSSPEVKAKLVEAMIRNEQGGVLPPAAAAAIPKVFAAGGGGSAASQGRATTGSTEAVPAAVAKSGGEPFIAARAAATTFSKRVAPLEQAQNELRANVGLNVGPGAQDMQNLQGIARTFGINMGAAATDNNKAFSIINKDLETYYRNVPNANNSDLARIEAKAANPSVQLQREALDELTSRVIGAERMDNAAYLNFVQQHGAPQASMYAPKYADEAAQYTQNLDPVGFAYDKMNLQQRTAYYKSLQTDTQRDAYWRSVREASRLYHLPLPTGAP